MRLLGWAGLVVGDRLMSSSWFCRSSEGERPTANLAAHLGSFSVLVLRLLLYINLVRSLCINLGHSLGMKRFTTLMFEVHK